MGMEEHHDRFIFNILIVLAVAFSVTSFSMVFGFWDAFSSIANARSDLEYRIAIEAFFGLLVGGNVLFLKFAYDAHILRRKLEVSLKEQGHTKERFNLAMDGSQDGIWDWDVKKGTCYYSSVFKQNLGFSDINFPEVIDSFYGVMSDEDVDAFDDTLQQHIMTQKPFELECRLRTKHAGYRWFKITASTVFDEDGTLERMVGSMRDIQYRIGMQEALNKELERIDYIFRRNPALIVAFDRAGNILSVNPKACQVSGYEEMELIGKNWWEIFFPGEAKEHYQSLVKYFKEQGEISNYEMLMTTKNGEKRIISWTSLNSYDENKKIDEIIGFGIDVTERNAYQSQLLEAKDEAENARKETAKALDETTQELLAAVARVSEALEDIKSAKLTKAQEEALVVIKESCEGLVRTLEKNK